MFIILIGIILLLIIIIIKNDIKMLNGGRGKRQKTCDGQLLVINKRPNAKQRQNGIPENTNDSRGKTREGGGDQKKEIETGSGVGGVTGITGLTTITASNKSHPITQYQTLQLQTDLFNYFFLLEERIATSRNKPAFYFRPCVSIRSYSINN